MPLPFTHETSLQGQTEPVTQAIIIIAIVAFSSGSLAPIAIYSNSPSVVVLCAVVLAIIVYSAPRLPRH
jgi:hypothetical protein